MTNRRQFLAALFAAPLAALGLVKRPVRIVRAFTFKVYGGAPYIPEPIRIRTVRTWTPNGVVTRIDMEYGSIQAFRPEYACRIVG